jgi:hypothetical protein
MRSKCVHYIDFKIRAFSRRTSIGTPALVSGDARAEPRLDPVLIPSLGRPVQRGLRKLNTEPGEDRPGSVEFGVVAGFQADDPKPQVQVARRLEIVEVPEK